MFEAQWKGFNVLVEGSTFQAEWQVDVDDSDQPRRFRLLANLEFRSIGLEIEWVLVETDHPSDSCIVSVPLFGTFVRFGRVPGRVSVAATYRVVWQFDVRSPDETFYLVLDVTLDPEAEAAATYFHLSLRRDW